MKSVNLLDARGGEPMAKKAKKAKGSKPKKKMEPVVSGKKKK